MSLSVKKTVAAVTFALGATTLSVPVLADKSPVDDVEGSLSVMVLGSGGPQIQSSGHGRASAGYLIFADGQPAVLMDLGSGTFKSLGMSGAHIGQVKYYPAQPYAHRSCF